MALDEGFLKLLLQLGFQMKGTALKAEPEIRFKVRMTKMGRRRQKKKIQEEARCVDDGHQE